VHAVSNAERKHSLPNETAYSLFRFVAQLFRC